MDLQDQSHEQQSEESQDGKALDNETISKPIVVDDGNCVHNWEFLFKDGDGRDNYKCTKCMHGRAE